jgi:GNAT superfamily N-acetyltransferase
MPRRARVEPASSSLPIVVRAPDVGIEEVTDSPTGRDAFLQFQLDHYRGDPNFVSPIFAERRDFLDQRRNPFFREADAAFFLARRRGAVVGRIAAVVDRRSNRFHGRVDGFFGLFESQNDAGLAAALLEAAMGWLRQRGMQRMLGPVNLAFHHDCGLLVEGFDRLPSMMMAYNPWFYGQLLEVNGFQRLADLCSYDYNAGLRLPEALVRVADRARRKANIVVRRLDTAHPDEDIRHIKAISETMLKPGFGLAPLSAAEFQESVHRLRPVILLRPELSLLVEVDGEPVAFIITVPEPAQALQAAGGRLFPFGLARLLLAARRIDRLRVLLFGIHDGFRRRGLDALLAHETYLAARALGYRSAELGWVMESDRLVVRAIEATGAKRIKVFRLYERAV